MEGAFLCFFAGGGADMGAAADDRKMEGIEMELGGAGEGSEKGGRVEKLAKTERGGMEEID